VRVCVVGAGVAGLTAAYRLTQAGHACDVYERWPGLGGQAATLDVGGGVRLERYYHHLFTSDRHVAELYEELGMGDELEWKPSSVAFFLDGRSWPFNGPADLLRFAPLSLRSRVRMGVAVLRLQRSRRGVEAYESETAAAWVRREMGAEAWKKVWGPLLRGKFGTRAEDIAMSWLQNKLTARRQLKGREARVERLGYPRGSWEPLFSELAARIESGGGRVLIDRPVMRIAPGFTVTAAAPGSFRRGHDPATFAADGQEDYDAVVATVPNDIFTGLLAPELADAIGPAYLGRLATIEYHTALCLLLELDRSFTPFYWTNVAERGLPFVGLIEQGNLVGTERYGGRHFLYVANYLAPGDSLLGLDPDALLAAYTPGLRAVNPAFDPAWVRARWRFEEPAAQPIVDVGYPARMAPLGTGVPGLVLANTTQIYPEDRGTSYSVRLGTEAAATLLRR